MISMFLYFVGAFLFLFGVVTGVRLSRSVLSQFESVIASIFFMVVGLVMMLIAFFIHGGG